MDVTMAVVMHWAGMAVAILFMLLWFAGVPILMMMALTDHVKSLRRLREDFNRLEDGYYELRGRFNDLERLAKNGPW